MKFASFISLLCSLLFISVYSKPLQIEDGEIESAIEEIKNAEEFLESLLSNLDKIDDQKLKDNFHGYVKYLFEFITLGPVNAIDIYERLSEIEELIHQATNIQSENKDDLKEVLKKVEKFEAVIKKYKEYQKADAVNSVKSRVEVVESMKSIINENPNNFPELVIEDADDVFSKLIKTPRYLVYLIKNNFPKIIENLWISEVAIESVKSAYPSEAEQLKEIIREAEAKIFSLKRETKRVAMHLDIHKIFVKYPEKHEILFRAREDLLQNNAVDTVSKREHIVNEDEQEELTDKIIASIPILERVNSSFIDEVKYAVEAFKSEFPNDIENSTKFERHLERLERKFNDFVDSTKTLAEKIKLDTAKGVRTNPLYIEMFMRITKLKFADVFLAQWGIFKGIENVINPLLPLGEAKKIDENTTRRKILFDQMSEGLKTLLNCTDHYRSQPGPLDEYLEFIGADFEEFTPGLFPWVENLPALYLKYVGVRV